MARLNGSWTWQWSTVTPEPVWLTPNRPADTATPAIRWPRPTKPSAPPSPLPSVPAALILEAEDVARLTGVLNLTHALVNSTVNVAAHNIDQVRRDVDRLRALLESRAGAG